MRGRERRARVGAERAVERRGLVVAAVLVEAVRHVEAQRRVARGARAGGLLEGGQRLRVVAARVLAAALAVRRRGRSSTSSRTDPPRPAGSAGGAAGRAADGARRRRGPGRDARRAGPAAPRAARTATLAAARRAVASGLRRRGGSGSSSAERQRRRGRGRAAPGTAPCAGTSTRATSAFCSMPSIAAASAREARVLRGDPEGAPARAARDRLEGRHVEARDDRRCRPRRCL